MWDATPRYYSYHMSQIKNTAKMCANILQRHYTHRQTLRLNHVKNAPYPRVVMVTMVYQKEAGMEVKLESSTFFSQ